MASSLFGNNSAPMQPMRNGPMGMIGNIRQFANMLRGRGDPQQLVMNYMRQNNLSQQHLDAAMQQAQEIAQMMGLR